jgi:hypothetical protein
VKYEAYVRRTLTVFRRVVVEFPDDVSWTEVKNTKIDGAAADHSCDEDWIHDEEMVDVEWDGPVDDPPDFVKSREGDIRPHKVAFLSGNEEKEGDE